MTHVHTVQQIGKEIKRVCQLWHQTRCTPDTQKAVLIIICSALAPVGRLLVTVHETVSTALTKECIAYPWVPWARITQVTEFSFSKPRKKRGPWPD